MIGTISIRNLEFQGRHGATAVERRTLRRFQVDIDVHADLSRAIASDRLADTVDYAGVSAIVIEVGTTRTFHLLEALAGAIADAIAKRHPGVGLEVEVRKLNPPCAGNPAFTAVRVARPLGAREGA